jgi:hypothetical protein
MQNNKNESKNARKTAQAGNSPKRAAAGGSTKESTQKKRTGTEKAAPATGSAPSKTAKKGEATKSKLPRNAEKKPVQKSGPKKTTAPQQKAASSRTQKVAVEQRANTSGVNFAEIIDLATAMSIARIDAQDKGLTTLPDKYVNANKWEYYIAINLWYHVVYDSMHLWDPMGNSARRLVDHIVHYGLVATVRIACTLAQSIVSQSVPEEEILQSRLGFLCKPKLYNSRSNLQGTLQRLRFLKRLSPLEADALGTTAVKAWLAEEKRVASYNRRNMLLNTRYWFVQGRIKALLAEWLKNYKPVTVAELVSELPTGATFDKVWDTKPDGKKFKRSLNMRERLHKYADLAHDGQRWIYASVDAGRETPRDTAVVDEIRETREDGPYTLVWVHRVKRDGKVKRNALITVPKDIKKPRIVCPEEVVNQIMQRKIRDHVWDCLPRFVKEHLPLRDQTVMEAHARWAALSGDFTTRDLSHASDSYSVRCFCDAYPPLVRGDVMRWRPEQTILPDGTAHRLEQLSTMGTGDVWILMALHLLAAMAATEQMCSRRKFITKRGSIGGCWAFGDDCIHPSRIDETLDWVLDVLGFVTNHDKTFGGDHPYRESCGSEWWHVDDMVWDIRTLYFPRFPIQEPQEWHKPTRDYDPIKGEWRIEDGFTRLIELQHALYYDFPHAAEFISRAVKRLMPDMTTSLAGTVCQDLWGPFPMGPQRELRVAKPSSQEEVIVRSWGCHTVTFKPHIGKPMPEVFNEDFGLPTTPNVRLGHYVAEVTTSKEADKALWEDALVREQSYQTFLRLGPTAHDDVLALLGCTESARPRDETNQVIRWVIKF